MSHYLIWGLAPREEYYIIEEHLHVIFDTQ